MFWIAILMGISCASIAWYISSSSNDYGRKASGLSPYFFIFIYIIITQLDFLSMYLNGYGGLATYTIRSPYYTLSTALAIHNAAIMSGLLAIIFVKRFAKGAISRRDFEPRTRAALILLIAVSLAFTFPIFAGVYRGDNIFSIGTEFHRAENRNTLNFFFAILIPPLLSVWLTRANFLKATVVCGILAIILIGTGSRTRILYVAICYIFYLCYIRRHSVRRHHVLFFVAVSIVLASSALNYRRASQLRDSNITVTEVFDLSRVFQTADFPSAEAWTLVISRPRELQPYPLEEFVGAAMSPIPRVVAPFKPLDGSAQFTMEYDPYNYQRYGRGLTVGSIVELYTGYGALGMAFWVSVLFAVWAFYVERFKGRRDVLGFLGLVCMYLALYNFLRNDIQNAGQILVVFAFVGVFFTKRIRATPDDDRSSSRTRTSPARSRRLSGAQPIH